MAVKGHDIDLIVIWQMTGMVSICRKHKNGMAKIYNPSARRMVQLRQVCQRQASQIEFKGKPSMAGTFYYFRGGRPMLPRPSKKREIVALYDRENEHHLFIFNSAGIPGDEFIQTLKEFGTLIYQDLDGIRDQVGKALSDLSVNITDEQHDAFVALRIEVMNEFDSSNFPFSMYHLMVYPVYDTVDLKAYIDSYRKE